MVARPARGALALASALTRPRETLRQASQTALAVAKLATSAWPAAGSSLTGPIGRQRRYAWARASLADVKEIKRAFGGTVNDIVLADLPVHLADPLDRLEAIRAAMSDLKAVREASAGEALITLGRFTPFPLASLTVRIAYRLPQREIVTVTTNVPGPQQPLYSLGRRLVEIIPYVPIATSLRTGVSIFSYCDRMTFGITGDYATTPDIDVLARGIEQGVSELTEAVRRD